TILIAVCAFPVLLSEQDSEYVQLHADTILWLSLYHPFVHTPLPASATLPGHVVRIRLPFQDVQLLCRTVRIQFHQFPAFSAHTYWLNLSCSLPALAEFPALLPGDSLLFLRKYR